MTSLKKYFSMFLVVSYLIFAFCACAMSSTENRLVGTWVNTADLGPAGGNIGRAEKFEIFKDGTLVWEAGDYRGSYSYEIIHDGNAIEIAKNENAHVIFDINLQGRTLELTVIGGNDNNGTVYCFTKE